MLHLKYDLYLLLSLPGWQEWKWKDKSNKNKVYVTELHQSMAALMQQFTETQKTFCEIFTSSPTAPKPLRGLHLCCFAVQPNMQQQEEFKP